MTPSRQTDAVAMENMAPIATYFTNLSMSIKQVVSSKRKCAFFCTHCLGCKGLSKEGQFYTLA